MAGTTITVLDSTGATKTAQLITAPGTQADVDSSPVAFSTEGKAQLGSLTETAPASDVASSGLNGRMQRLAQRMSSLIALVPAAIGRTNMAGSLSITTASDDALTGIVTETAPASDTASSGLNGRLQRIAQNISTFIAKFPAALGQTTKAASLSVALASDDALLGLCTAPATGTQTSVAGSATDVTILASNALRKGAYIQNDSAAILYLLLATGTSSTTNFTQKLAAGDSFSMAPGTYTGVLKGIWASATGSARVTEFS